MTYHAKMYLEYMDPRLKQNGSETDIFGRDFFESFYHPPVSVKGALSQKMVLDINGFPKQTIHIWTSGKVYIKKWWVID